MTPLPLNYEEVLNAYPERRKPFETLTALLPTTQSYLRLRSWFDANRMRLAATTAERLDKMFGEAEQRFYAIGTRLRGIVSQSLALGYGQPDDVQINLAQSFSGFGRVLFGVLAISAGLALIWVSLPVVAGVGIVAAIAGLVGMIAGAASFVIGLDALAREVGYTGGIAPVVSSVASTVAAPAAGLGTLALFGLALWIFGPTLARSLGGKSS